MQKWEYKTLGAHTANSLNELGEQGWEVCASNDRFMILKRPKRSSSPWTDGQLRKHFSHSPQRTCNLCRTYVPPKPTCTCGVKTPQPEYHEHDCPIFLRSRFGSESRGYGDLSY